MRRCYNWRSWCGRPFGAPAGRKVIIFGEGLQRYWRGLKGNTINLAFVSGAYGVTMLLALGSSVLVARLAGPEVFGEFTLFMVIFVIATIIGDSLDTTFIRFASSPGAESEEACHYAVHISAKVLYAIVISVAGWVLAPLVADIAFHKPEGALLIRAAAVAGGLVSVYNAIVAFYRRRQRFFVVAVLMPAFNATILMAVGGLVVAGSTLDAASLAYVYVLAAMALALISAGRFLAMRLSMGARPWVRLVNFFRVAAPLMGASVVAQIANRLDVFFLASYVAFADLGHYGVAIRIATILGMVTGAFGTILVPKAAAAIHDRIRLRRYLAIGGFYSALFTAAAAALLVFIEPVASLLFGEQYRGVEAIAVVLIVSVGLRTYTIPFQSMIPFGPRPANMVYLSVASLAVTALLLTVLVPRFGIVGGAYAVAGASAIMFVATSATALLTAWPKATVKIEQTG